MSDACEGRDRPARATPSQPAGTRRVADDPPYTSPAMSELPIRPYERLPAAFHPWDPGPPEVARGVGTARRLGAAREPSSSTSAARGARAAGQERRRPRHRGGSGRHPRRSPTRCSSLGFGRQTGPAPFPPTRPMLAGDVDHEGEPFRIHLHVIPPARRRARRARRVPRRTPRGPALGGGYAEAKREIARGAPTASRTFGTRSARPLRPGGAVPDGSAGCPRTADPLPPGATIGILGGGQLGRMLALAAREMGYRIAVLDPDPACPAAAVADERSWRRYDDARRGAPAGRALRRRDLRAGARRRSPSAAVAARGARCGPGCRRCRSTQDRLAERRFLEVAASRSAPWREVRTDRRRSRRPRTSSGYPLRLKAAIGGYDGRSQVRIAGADEVAARRRAPRRRRGRGRCSWSGAGLRGGAVGHLARGPRRPHGRVPGRAERPRRAGSSSRAVAPAPIDPVVVGDAMGIAERLARGLDLVGLLTVELFLLRGRPAGRQRARAAGPQQRPLDDRGRATSQFEQHIRARSAGCRWASTAAARRRRRWSTCWARAGPAGPADRRGGRARATRRPRPPVRQAAGVRAAQDGPRDGRRHGRRRGARARPARPRAALRLGGREGRASPLVGIVGGSRSDFPVLEKASAVLDRAGRSRPSCGSCPPIARPTTCSATRRRRAGRGIRVIVAGAGGAAHLPGMLAAKTTLPVIGVPIPTQHLGGLDSLLSIVQMPRGVPVATVAIGNAENAALLAAQILALVGRRRWRPGRRRAGARRPTRSWRTSPTPRAPHRGPDRRRRPVQLARFGTGAHPGTPALGRGGPRGPRRS